MCYQIVDLQTQAHEYYHQSSLKNLPDQGEGLISSTIELRPDLLLDPLDRETLILRTEAKLSRYSSLKFDILAIDRQGKVIVVQCCRGDKQQTLQDVASIMTEVAKWSPAKLIQRALERDHEIRQFLDSDASINYGQELVLVAETSTFTKQEIVTELGDQRRFDITLNEFDVDQGEVGARMFFMMHKQSLHASHQIEYVPSDESEVMFLRVFSECSIGEYFC